jgi:hypothetical protein
MSRIRRNREVEVFSLSFLDCICCGFGAIILLLVISEFGEPIALEKSRADLQNQIRALQQELYEIRGDSEELSRELQGRIDTLDKEKLKVARLSGDLTDIRGQFSASTKDSSVSNTVETALVSAYQELTADMQRLLKSSARRKPQDAVGGIPVDSEYVILLVDTSASMTTYHWDAAIQSIQEILTIYPKVKGIQILNDNGKPMIAGSRGQWLGDTPSQRQDIVSKMKTWRAFSDSNPVDGIEEAIRTYWAADKRISIYVLGDEFTGESMQAALDGVTKVNKSAQAGGQRLVRIHAIGFPEGAGMPPFTSIRFSALMRLMCEQNGGTFVATL